MAIASTRYLALPILVVAGTLMIGSLLHVSAQCQGSIPGLIAQCSRFVQKYGPQIPPSPECCGVAKAADVPCLCNLVTKEIESFISMQKAVFVAKICGLPIHAGMKCGSYTVPPKA